MSYVYFITDDNGHVKIGKADNVWERLCELQTGNPFKLRILLMLSFPTNIESFKAEKELHRRFASVRMEGEWFQAGPVLEMLEEKYIHVLNYSFLGRNAVLT